MKLLLFVSAIAAIASSASAAAASTVHLRVHVREGLYDPVGEFGQCKFDGKPTMDCQRGLICQVQDQYYGQCFKERASLWEQCGGKGWDGSCRTESDGSVCVRLNDYYSQCQPGPAKTN